MRSTRDGGPIAMTTRDALARDGPLAEVGRALASSGVIERLAGVLERDYEFPLDSTSTSALALALMHQVCGGKSARWRAYCDALPRDVDSLLMWTDDELEALQGSRLRARAIERRELVQREYDVLFPALANASPEVFGDERFTPQLFRWAYATVLARAFMLPDLKCMALLPGIDLYNSARDADKCTVDLGASADASDGGANDLDGASVTLAVGVGGAEAGDQLFHDYADHASGGALLEFGFVYHGDYERGVGSYAMDISLESAFEALDAASRASLVDRDIFAKFNIRKSLTFEISNVAGVYKPALKGLACVKPEMMRAARALALGPDDVEPSSLDVPAPPTVERRALDIIATALSRERERYIDTSVTADAELLAHMLKNPNAVDAAKAAEAKAKAASKPPIRRHPRRFTMALEVRLGEKRLLDDILDDIRATVAREPVA